MYTIATRGDLSPLMTINDIHIQVQVFLSHFGPAVPFLLPIRYCAVQNFYMYSDCPISRLTSPTKTFMHTACAKMITYTLWTLPTCLTKFRLRYLITALVQYINLKSSQKRYIQFFIISDFVYAAWVINMERPSRKAKDVCLEK